MAKLIYVADDEKNIRSLMKTFLESEGYEVEVFSDGYSVRKAAEQRMPDLIILDVMMPGEDGFNVCAGIRKNSSVPIIIVSAKDSPLDKVAGLTLGSDDYITKPFLPLELTARVKALFRRAELSSGDNRREWFTWKKNQSSSRRRNSIFCSTFSNGKARPYLKKNFWNKYGNIRPYRGTSECRTTW